MYWALDCVARVLQDVRGSHTNHGLVVDNLATGYRHNVNPAAPLREVDISVDSEGLTSALHGREVVFLTVIPEGADDETLAATVRGVTRLAAMRIPVKPTVQVIRSDDAVGAILAEAARFDLLILGLRSKRGRKTIGPFNRKLAFAAPCAVILLSRRPATTDVARPIREVAKVLPWQRRTESEGV